MNTIHLASAPSAPLPRANIREIAAVLALLTPVFYALSWYLSRYFLIPAILCNLAAIVATGVMFEMWRDRGYPLPERLAMLWGVAVAVLWPILTHFDRHLRPPWEPLSKKDLGREHGWCAFGSLLLVAMVVMPFLHLAFLGLIPVYIVAALLFHFKKE